MPSVNDHSMINNININIDIDSDIDIDILISAITKVASKAESLVRAGLGAENNSEETI